MAAFPQHNASQAEWADWRWQMRHRIHDQQTLERYVRLTEGEREAIARTEGLFRWTIGGFASTRNPLLYSPISGLCPRHLSTLRPPRRDIGGRFF